MTDNLKKIRRTANIGLYGSIAVIILAVVFHFSPFRITPQQPDVQRWMLIAGSVLAVLAIVIILMTIRKAAPAIRQLDSVDCRVKNYAAYISNLYIGSLSVVLVECVLIVLMSDTSLLMVTILLVLLLFLSYPNMYKMKGDLGLTDEQMSALFGDDYCPGNGPADVRADLEEADARLELDGQQPAAKGKEQEETTGELSSDCPGSSGSK